MFKKLVTNLSQSTRIILETKFGRNFGKNSATFYEKFTCQTLFVIFIFIYFLNESSGPIERPV